MKKLLLLLALSNSAIAGYGISAEQLPAGCLPINYQLENNEVQLGANSNEQQLFLIQNKSNSSVWLDHKTSQPLSAGWTSELKKQNWSAIAINKNNFNLSCLEINPGSEQIVSCTQVLQVCQYPRAIFQEGLSGNYWVAENRERSELFSSITSRGIKPL